jgi:hypothetical protein
LRGDYLSTKIKNRKGEEGEKVLKVGPKKGKTAQKRAMIALKTYIFPRNTLWPALSSAACSVQA